MCVREVGDFCGGYGPVPGFFWPCKYPSHWAEGKEKIESLTFSLIL